MRKTGVVAVLVLALCLSGCAVRQRIETVPVPAVDDSELVRLHRRVNQDGPDTAAGYDHPRRFSPEEIQTEMALLIRRRFQWGQYGLGNQWRAEPLFSLAARERLAPALIAAFAAATPADRVAFTLVGKEGNTTGEVFVKNNRLVWVLEAVDGVDFRGKDRYWLDDAQWTIEEKAGLTVKTDKDCGRLTVVRDLTVPAAATAEASAEKAAAERPASKPPEEVARQKSPPPAPAPPSPAPPVRSLEEKLRLLKNWEAQGLINAEDYAREKTMILEQLRSR